MTSSHLTSRGKSLPGNPLLLACALASSTLTPAMASTLDIELGLAALYETAHVLGEDPSLTPAPYIELEYDNFTLNLSELAYSLPLSYVRTLNVELGYRKSPFDSGENTRLAQLDKRDTAIELTLALNEASPVGTLGVFITADASGVYQGFETGLEYSLKLPVNGGTLAPGTRVRYLSSNLVDYYYGVAPQQSDGEIPAYQADASVHLDLELIYTYPITPHWFAVSALEWTKFGAGQAKSPISKTSHATRAFFAVIYSF